MTFERAVMLIAWTVIMLITVGLLGVGALMGDCADPVGCEASKHRSLLLVGGIGVAIYSAGVVWLTRRRGA